MTSPPAGLECDRFAAYCSRKETAALAAHPAGFSTVFAAPPPADAASIGNDWTRRLFDGPFYVTRRRPDAMPAVSLVFVQSRDGNTGAPNPSTLGGGDTDLHVIYEGLSRVAADAVLSGATTARAEQMVFSVWHPELVALRRQLGLPRHPAQVVITNGGDVPYERGLMFNTPELRTFLIAPGMVARDLAARLRMRPSVNVIDAGQPMDLASALRQLREHGLEVISCVGGRRTATELIAARLVTDLYLTTSPKDGGEPNTPYSDGPPLRLTRLMKKVGRGDEAGVRFEHFRL